MNLPLKTIISALHTRPAGFNLVHFRDTAHNENVPAHFWVSIATGDGQHILLSIVTTQMANLEKKYSRSDNADEALDCLVPLSKSDFKEITKPCVIDCNETKFLSTEQLAEKIDTSYSSAKSKDCFNFIHYDNDFATELKNKIIRAVSNSPYILPEVKAAVDRLTGLLSI